MGRVRTVLLVLGCSASACSLFVGLDDLRGPVAPDASNESAATDAPVDVVNDVSAPVEAAVDAPAHTIAFVQEIADYYSSAGLTFSSSVIDGDAVIVVVANSVPGAVVVSDAKGNAYTPIVGPYGTSDGGTLSLFVAFDVKGGFANIHVSAPDGGTGYIYYASEYSGISTLDGFGTGSTQSTGTDALVTSSVPTTANPELLFAYAEGLGDVSSGTSFTTRSTFDGNAIEERIVMAAGSYQATATQFGDTGDIVLACFH